MAHQIAQDYEGADLHLLGVLTGCFMFFTDLVKELELDVPVSFIKMASYKGLKSTGNVAMELDVPASLENRDVLVIDDILDTGNSYRHLLPLLQKQRPKSIKLATLLYKPTANTLNRAPEYFGFSIEDVFVVGYGLDYNHYGRNYKSIYKLKN